MFKSLHNLFSTKPDTYVINSEMYSHDARLIKKIHIEQLRTKISQFAITKTMTQIYGILYHQKKKEIPNINIFKLKLKLYLITI